MENKNEIYEIFKKVSNELEIIGVVEPVSLLIIGGTAILLSTENGMRPTYDIDAYKLTSNKIDDFKKIEETILNGYDINFEVYNLEDLKLCMEISDEYKLWNEFKYVKVYTPINEQIFLSKIYSIVTREDGDEKIQSDADDLITLIDNGLDIKLLGELFNK